MLIISAFTDVTTQATEKQSACLRPASITIIDVLHLNIHAIFIVTDSGYCIPHFFLMSWILFQGCLVNEAGGTVQSTMRNHFIQCHLFGL